MRESRLFLLGAFIMVPWCLNVGGWRNWGALAAFVWLFFEAFKEEYDWEQSRRRNNEWLEDIKKLDDRAKTLAARAQGHEKPHGDDHRPD